MDHSDSFNLSLAEAHLAPSRSDSVKNPVPLEMVFNATETPIDSKGMTPSSRDPGTFREMNLKHALTLSDEQFYAVSGELQKNIAFVKTYKPLQELEVELFDICKEYEQLFTMRTVDLTSVRSLYPISQLQDFSDYLDPQDSSTVAQDVNAVISKTPWGLLDYKWIYRVIRFLNILVMKWELVDSNHYRYRNESVSPTDPLQLDKHKQRQLQVFTMETLWFACASTESPLRTQLPQTLVSMAKVLQNRTVELLRLVASLNFKVNFRLHPDVREYLALKSDDEALYHTKKQRVKPDEKQTAMSVMGERLNTAGKINEAMQVVGQQALERGLRHKPVKTKLSSKEKKLRYTKAHLIGFHLLELPTVLCKCLEHDFHIVNLQLKGRLERYEELYRVFEFHFLKLAAQVPSASGTMDVSAGLKPAVRERSESIATSEGHIMGR